MWNMTGCFPWHLLISDPGVLLSWGCCILPTPGHLSGAALHYLTGFRLKQGTGLYSPAAELIFQFDRLARYCDPCLSISPCKDTVVSNGLTLATWPVTCSWEHATTSTSWRLTVLSHATWEGRHVRIAPRTFCPHMDLFQQHASALITRTTFLPSSSSSVVSFCSPIMLHGFFWREVSKMPIHPGAFA